MSLKKKYLKSKPVCKVTFNVTKKQAKGVKVINLVGDFNEWSTEGTKMRKLKDGSFTRTLDLEKGRGYQFRYLADGTQWINDISADAYVPSGVSYEENCVVEV